MAVRVLVTKSEGRFQREDSCSDGSNGFPILKTPDGSPPVGSDSVKKKNTRERESVNAAKSGKFHGVGGEFLLAACSARKVPKLTASVVKNCWQGSLPGCVVNLGSRLCGENGHGGSRECGEMCLRRHLKEEKYHAHQ